MSLCTEGNEVWHSKILWTYLQVLFELLFCLTKILNMAMAQNFKVMLEQMLNHSVWHFVQYHISL
jgi:hypothetical protein